MGSRQHHFVLVHGAGHGPWCWVKILEVLERAGHRVTTVDLLSGGDKYTFDADDVTSLEQYNRPLEDLFDSFPADEKVILVGHSLGGMSLTRITELYSKQISVAVYLAAFMPAPGLDLNDVKASDPDFIPVSGSMIAHSKVEGGPITSLEFPYQVLKDRFYNKCSPEDFAFALERMRRFPSLAPLLLPVAPTEANNYSKVPRVYVLSKYDGAIDPYSARKMVTLNPPNEFYEIEADHSLFFSAVDIVETILIDSAAKYDIPASEFQLDPKSEVSLSQEIIV